MPLSIRWEGEKNVEIKPGDLPVNDKYELGKVHSSPLWDYYGPFHIFLTR